MIYSIDKMLNIIPSKYQLVYVASKRAEAMEQTKFYQMEEDLKQANYLKNAFLEEISSLQDKLENKA